MDLLEEFGDVDDDPAWIGIGYMTADIGLLIFLIASGWPGSRPAGSRPGSERRRAISASCSSSRSSSSSGRWAPSRTRHTGRGAHRLSPLVLAAGTVVVGLPADDVVLPVELDLDRAAVRQPDLDVVRRAVVADLGLDDRAAARVRERRGRRPGGVAPSAAGRRRRHRPRSRSRR